LGIVGPCIPVVSRFSFILAIAGIVLGVMGKTKPGAKLGKAGMICGIVGIVLWVVIVLVLAGILAAIYAGAASSSLY